MKKTVIKITLLIILTILIIVVVLFIYSRPKIALNRTMGIELPKSGEIIDYEYWLFSDSYKIKISFDVEDYSFVKQQLENYFTSNYWDESYNKDPFYPSWNIEKSVIVDGYGCFKSDKFAMTRDVNAFITKSPEGQYFLYVISFNHLTQIPPAMSAEFFGP